MERWKLKTYLNQWEEAASRTPPDAATLVRVTNGLRAVQKHSKSPRQEALIASTVFPYLDDERPVIQHFAASVLSPCRPFNSQSDMPGEITICIMDDRSRRILWQGHWKNPRAPEQIETGQNMWERFVSSYRAERHGWRER